MGGLDLLAADDPDNIVKEFLDGLHSDVSTIVNEGYKEDSKKQLCKGTLKLTTSEAKTYTQSIDYSSQKTEDSRASFIVAADLQNFVTAVKSDAYRYYSRNRWKGDWNGAYACEGIGGASTGPQGPFTMQVSLVLTPSTDGSVAAKLERTTRGGGFERLVGSASGGEIRVSGTGQNSPDDIWLTSFRGIAKGRSIIADGTINLPSGVTLRRCNLDLIQSGN